MWRAPGLFLLLTLALAAQTPKKATPKRTTPAPAAALPKPVEQNQANEPKQPFPIERILIKGSNLYKPEAIQKLIGLEVGQPFDDDKLKAGYEKLVVHGAFGHVNYWYEPADSQKGYNVTYEVTDVDLLLPFKFEGLPGDDKKLREFLHMKEPLFAEKIPATQPIMDRYRALIVEFLGPKASVQAKVISDKGSDLFVLFSPTGLLPAIAEVSFKGNNAILSSVLQSSIHGISVGVEYSEARFRELLQSGIVPLYEGRGRLRVTFPKIEVKPAAEGVKGVALIVTIDEGPSYTLGDVQAEGGAIRGEELARISGLKPGEVANYDAIKEGQNKIHAAHQKLGYMKVNSKIVRKIDDKGNICDVTYRVEPGAQFKFGKLYMKGLDLHGEYEVKRLWTMKPGDLFNVEFPTFFLERLKEEGIFDNLKNTRAVSKPNEADSTVDVTLIFNEKGTKL